MLVHGQGSQQKAVLQGGEGQYFYVVCEGQFDVVVNTGTGPMVLHTYSSGDHANSAFGELALVTGRPHAAQIVARTEGMVQADSPSMFFFVNMHLII